MFNELSTWYNQVDESFCKQVNDHVEWTSYDFSYTDVHSNN